MLKVVPLFLYTAISNSVNASILVPLMSLVIKDNQGWDSDKTNQFCLLAMIGLGVGEIIGAQVFG